MATPQGSPTHHLTVHHVIHQRPRLHGFLALVRLGGTAVGVLVFGLLALLNVQGGTSWLMLVGLAGVGGLVYGLYSDVRPYACRETSTQSRNTSYRSRTSLRVQGDRTMTRAERLAQQEARAKAKLEYERLKYAEAQRQRREEDKRLLTKRYHLIGQWADEAGLLALSDADLRALFALLTPLLATPNPVAVLAGLFAEPEAVEGVELVGAPLG